ncbi:MAG: shikimate dehydrogenase [Planctomycetota bacterium]|nr:shikimate dehydrogenase [Planctomycetota bacterium]
MCVSIGRTRHRMVIAEHRALAERGAELVELRLDWLTRPPDLTRLLTDRPTPVVVTCRRLKDKGKWRYDENQRLTLLRAAIVAGAEYVDLEEDIAQKIPRHGSTKRIISYHNFDETPDYLEEIHAQLSEYDPDIVKIVTMANSPADGVRMLKLVSESRVPTAGFCMGELGAYSRILCGRYGAPFSYGTFSSERELAPGQLSFDQMRQLYRFESITRNTKLFGVLGDPIAHSLSPLLHNFGFHHDGLDCVYLPLRVPKGTLPETLKEFSWLDFQGYSVTIPHKEAAIACAEFPEEIVADIGAANTLYRDEHNAWRADNTDLGAALTSIRMRLTEDDPSASLEGKQVLMLGAGGAARAIGLGLVRAGAALTVTNRTHSRAISLAKDLGCQQTNWENRGSVYADVLVNCTSVGMHPGVDESPFPQHWLREGMLVFDTVYNPEQTLLLKQAKERSCRTVTGIEMFIRQAAAQYLAFTGQPADLELLRDTLRRGISPVGGMPL